MRSRDLWLEPWPFLRGVADVTHLADPTPRMLALRRLLGLGATGHVVVYDARTLREPPVPGLVEPCQVLAPAPLAPRTRRAIALVEKASRLTGKPVAVVVYADRRPPRGPLDAHHGDEAEPR
jgi:hypothetical protein